MEVTSRRRSKASGGATLGLVGVCVRHSRCGWCSRRNRASPHGAAHHTDRATRFSDFGGANSIIGCTEFILGSTERFGVLLALAKAKLVQGFLCKAATLPCTIQRIASLVAHGPTIGKCNDASRSHGFGLGSGSRTGCGGNPTGHGTLHGILLLIHLLLGSLTTLLGQLILGQLVHFFFTLLRNRLRCLTLSGLLLRHLQLHLTGGGILLRLDLLERQQVEQVLRHLVPLLQRCRVATISGNAIFDRTEPGHGTCLHGRRHLLRCALRCTALGHEPHDSLCVRCLHGLPQGLTVVVGVVVVVVGVVEPGNSRLYKSMMPPEPLRI